MLTKTCSACGLVASGDESHVATLFHRNSDTGDGFQSRCKQCRRDGKTSNDREKQPKSIEEKLPPVTEHRLKGRVAQLELKIKDLLKQLDDAQLIADIKSDVSKIEVKPVVPRERPLGKLREALALAVASDWHIEEEVLPAQVAGRNRFNLEIAERRMQRFFEAVRYAIKFNRQIFKIRELMLAIIGDIINNYLRSEDEESNGMSPPQAIAWALASLEAGIRYLLEDPELERIIIPWMDGNHGRMYGKEKIRHATRTKNSLEWLLGTMLARAFRDEPRVQFIIAEGELLYTEVYGRTIRFLHGDLVKYAGGVGGVTIPLYKAVARWDKVRRADLTVLGHFHQLTSLSDIIINGSLIGYSPFSTTIGAPFEPPAQAFTVLDPLRFKSVSMPLWVSERDDDEMMREIEATTPSGRRAIHRAKMQAKTPESLKGGRWISQDMRPMYKE